MAIIKNWTLNAMMSELKKWGFSNEVNKVTGESFTSIRGEHSIMGPVFLNLSTSLVNEGAKMTKAYLKKHANELQVVQRDDAPENVLSICKRGKAFLEDVNEEEW